ncbi:MAG: carboxypeptidase-like regulatory domain-containing protein [Candidatus Burarchaeum sp.]|nr:carboxypeptidase-like regulatory domain-containing protein [Candidatus Burarchaeum sp.]MDO8339615.1 carboxypeptidase-like regulatory domain-containing protein [Candidatus Burarchaeum sp.]
MNAKTAASVPFLLALLFTLFLMPAASAYWAETIQVKVISSSGYPVPDVPVTIKYQYQVSVENFYISGTFDTGESGTGGYVDENPEGITAADLGVKETATHIIIEKKVVDLDLLDGLVQGKTNADGIFETGLIDYVDFGEVKEYLIIVGNEHRRTAFGENMQGTKHVELFMVGDNVRRIVLRTVDGSGRSLANVSAFVQCGANNQSGSTDKYGIFAFYAFTGSTCGASFSFGSITRSETLPNLATDLVLNVPLQVYDLAIQVVDDAGFPITANVLVVGFPPNATDENGRFSIRQFPASSAQVSITHNNRQQVVQVELTSNDFFTVAFDLTEPAISQVSHALDANGIARITATISDRGAHPSPISAAYVRYSTNKRKWTSLPMHPAGAYEFEAALPVQEPGAEVFYIIEALDARANKAISPEYSYLMPEKAAPPQPPISSTGLNIFGIHVDFIFFVPIVLVLLAIIIYKLRSS